MKKLYAIRDVAAESIMGGVFVAAADAAAVRMFSDVAADPQTIVSKHLTDFELLYLGTFNEESGGIESHFPVIVVTGIQLKAAQDAQRAPSDRPNGADVIDALNGAAHG